MLITLGRKSLRKGKDWLNCPWFARWGQSMNYSWSPQKAYLYPRVFNYASENSWTQGSEKWRGGGRGCELNACPSPCLPVWDRKLMRPFLLQLPSHWAQEQNWLLTLTGSHAGWQWQLSGPCPTLIRVAEITGMSDQEPCRQSSMGGTGEGVPEASFSSNWGWEKGGWCNRRWGNRFPRCMINTYFILLINF